MRQGASGAPGWTALPWTARVIAHYGNPSLSKIRTIMSDYREQTISGAKWLKLQKTIEEIKSLFGDTLGDV